MSLPVVAGLPPDLALPSGFVIRLTALDPTTGAVVPGVRVSDVSFYARNISGVADADAPLPLLVPFQE